MSGAVEEIRAAAHRYAETFSEMQRRNGYQTFSQRERLHGLSGAELAEMRKADLQNLLDTAARHLNESEGSTDVPTE